jgi:hypothetical protein
MLYHAYFFSPRPETFMVISPYLTAKPMLFYYQTYKAIVKFDSLKKSLHQRLLLSAHDHGFAVVIATVA